jgi:hypothetical protein
MRFLLSIKTVFPKPGGKVWYDDQREVHRQIFEGDETIDYAFMGRDPDAADNRWLREASAIAAGMASEDAAVEATSSARAAFVSLARARPRRPR